MMKIEKSVIINFYLIIYLNWQLFSFMILIGLYQNIREATTMMINKISGANFKPSFGSVMIFRSEYEDKPISDLIKNIFLPEDIDQVVLAKPKDSARSTGELPSPRLYELQPEQCAILQSRMESKNSEMGFTVKKQLPVQSIYGKSGKPVVDMHPDEIVYNARQNLQLKPNQACLINQGNVCYILAYDIVTEAVLREKLREKGLSPSARLIDDFDKPADLPFVETRQPDFSATGINLRNPGAGRGTEFHVELPTSRREPSGRRDLLPGLGERGFLDEE